MYASEDASESPRILSSVGRLHRKLMYYLDTAMKT